MNMTEQELNILCEKINLGEDEYQYTFARYFIQQYKKFYPEKAELLSEDNLYELYEARSYSKEDKRKAFIKIFTREQTPIKWYSDIFWSLLTYKESSECFHNWKNEEKWQLTKKEDIKYLSSRCNSSLTKLEKIRQAKYLKENIRPGLFEGLTHYLDHTKIVSDKLIELWMSLALKKGNKHYFKNNNVPYFLGYYNSNHSIDRDIEKDIKKTEVLGLFNTPLAYSLIEQIHKESFNNAILNEQTTNLLKKAGYQTEKTSLAFEEDKEEEVFYVLKRWINPEAFIQKKWLTPKESEKLLELFDYFITTHLAAKGIKVDCQWTERWNSEAKQNRKVYEIKMTMKYSFQKEETEEFLKKTFEGIHYFLESGYQSELKDYDTKTSQDKDKFYHFFKEFIVKGGLKKQIEQSLLEDDNKINDSNKPRKMKI